MAILAVVTKTANYTVVVTDEVILANSTGGPITITLTAAPVIGERYLIKDKAGTTVTNPITINGNGNLIDGNAAFVLTVKKQCAVVINDGTNWSVL